MHKKLAVSIASALLLGGATLVLAQTPAPTPTGVRSGARERAQNEREETRQKAQNVRQGIAANPYSAREEIKAKREALKEELEKKREEASMRVKAAHADAKTRVETKRVELEKRLTQFKDERKKAAAVRLDEQMARLNERWTTHFTNVLNRLEDILGKVKVRADKAAALGKNESAARTAITAAEAAIAAARTAVEAQAKKTYTATVTSEDQAKTAFRQAKEQLRKDLFALRDGAMKAARDAVQNAARALAGITDVDEEPENGSATSTGSSTSTDN